MVRCLKEEGVQVVFGYPGAAIAPFYDRLSKHDIRHILVRQEQNAGHAASGYARAAHKTGVCIATSGPGATNLITALATAYMDSIPLVAITGQVATGQIGKDVFQEADITGSAEPFTKHSYLVKNAEDIPRVFKEAFYIAGSGRPGPVLVDLPVDVQQEKLAFRYPEEVRIRGYKPTVNGHPGQISRAVKAINDSSRPILCVGGGAIASQSEDLVRALAEQAGIPVVATLMGIGAMPSEHPLFLGMLGMHGSTAVNRAIRSADLLIVAGGRLGDRALAVDGHIDETARIIHIDIDPAEIGKNLDTAIPIVGNLKNVLADLLSRSPMSQSEAWLKQLREESEALYDAERQRKPGCMDPRAFIRTLSGRMKPGDMICSDVGQNQIWSAGNVRIKGTRFITSGGMGTMGYALPAAEGAKLACPENQVVAVCGDGSFQMQMMELGTICQHDIGVKVVIMNNGYLGMVRELQARLYGGNITATQLSGSPDFIKLADAYGIPGSRLAGNDNIEAAVDTMLAHPGVYLLECIVDPDEATI